MIALVVLVLKIIVLNHLFKLCINMFPFRVFHYILKWGVCRLYYIKIAPMAARRRVSILQCSAPGAGNKIISHGYKGWSLRIDGQSKQTAAYRHHGGSFARSWRHPRGSSSRQRFFPTSNGPVYFLNNASNPGIYKRRSLLCLTRAELFRAVRKLSDIQ